MQDHTKNPPPETLSSNSSQGVPPPSNDRVRTVLYQREAHESLWDQFVLRSMNGTVFHRQQFLAYHPEGRFHFHHLLFFRGEKLVAVLPGGLKNNGRIFESPAGASYGSFVTEDLSAQTALDVVEAFEQYVREIRIEEVYLTSAPVIYQPVLTQNLDFALLYRGYAYQRHYISHSIDLRKTGLFLDRVHATARRNIRRQEQQQEVVIEHVSHAALPEALAEFYPIMIANKLRHDTTPTHSLEDLLRLHELLPDLLEFFSYRYNGEMVAGFLFFVANPRVFLSFYPMLRYEFSHLKPIYPLTASAYDWAARHGFAYIDLGVSQDTNDENPMTPALSLIHFKEKFDSRGVLRSTLFKKYPRGE